MQKKHKRKNKQQVWLSQNFLTSKKTVSRIVHRANIYRNDHIIEIGPGRGSITKVLLEKCRNVTAVEIDGSLVKYLTEKFGSTESLKLINADFLKWHLPNQGRYKIFANIPFSITSSIIKKISASENPPVDVWLVMDKGAAKMYMGLPCETKTSLMLKPVFDMKIVYYFQKCDFKPSPSVDTVMVHFHLNPEADVIRWAQYIRFVNIVFSKGFYGLMAYMTKNQLLTAMRKAGIPRDFTPADTLYVQWLCLFRQYIKFNHK